MNAMSILLLASRSLHVIVYLGMLGFALARASRTPRASALVAAAAISMLAGFGISMVVPILLSRVMPPQEMITFMGGVHLLASLLFCVGLVLLTAAALGGSSSADRPFSTPPSRDVG